MISWWKIIFSCWKAISIAAAIMTMFDSTKYMMAGDELRAVGLYFMSVLILLLVCLLDAVEKDGDQATCMDNEMDLTVIRIEDDATRLLDTLKKEWRSIILDDAVKLTLKTGHPYIVKIDDVLTALKARAILRGGEDENVGEVED
jgi:hypothetical protein